MTTFTDRLLRTTLGEWARFGGSTRSITDRWSIAGDEYDDPYRGYIGEYWASVGQPDWDGRTREPWSGAFISWCFETAGAGRAFPKNAKHSVYVDRIRRNAASPLKLLDCQITSIQPSDLIWNSRQDNGSPHFPKSYAAAISLLDSGIYFLSHVDVVTEVRTGECDSIGGNVSNRNPGGSVTKSTWRLDANGVLTDPRKTWIGVVRVGL